MTDQELARWAVQVNRLELAARAWMEAAGHDAPERQSAQQTMRQAGALRRELEQWIIARATRVEREQVQAARAAVMS